MPRSLSSLSSSLSSRTRLSPLPLLLLFSLFSLFVVRVVANASGEDDAGRRKSGRRNLVVLVHGMGDTCCNPHSLGAIERAIAEREGKNNNETSKVISIKFGRNGMSDFISGFIGNAFALVEDFGCKQLRRAKEEEEEEEEEEGKKIDGETIVLGFSQGGVFARAMVETCED